ncbi:MAG TPA: hypothetical protein VK205_06225 [Prolixibacteraceae bacterium]|nr:hypothetical protein [Prolixibacteraceae bacterium]
MKKNLPLIEKKLFKNLFVMLFLLMFSEIGFAQGVAVNPTNEPANASAGLDINFSDKGFLISRVALTAVSNSAPLSAHVAGMIVYNTVTTADVTEGLYYNDGTKWVPIRIPSGLSTGDMQYWNGTTWILIPVGQPGQKLKLNSSGVPQWSN